MPKKNNGPPWTPDAIAAEAKRYRTRKDFAQHSYGAYDAARRQLGILDEVCQHMASGSDLRKQRRLEEVKHEISRCKTLHEFRTNHYSAYNYVIRNKRHDLLETLRRDDTPPGWWTLERIAAEAKKFKTRTAFARGSGGAYNAAHRRKWLDQVCGHMQRTQKPNGYWTRKRVLAKAKEYKTRGEFQRHAGGAHGAAAKGGYLDVACPHMTRLGSAYERAIYAIEFTDRSVYVGLTFDYDKREREHRTHNTRISKKVRKVGANFRRFDKWLPLEQAGKEEARIMETYRKRGWRILNKNVAGGAGSRPRKWSRDEVEALAATCNSVSEFKKQSASACMVAHRRGWWVEISKNLTKAIEHGKWTPSALAREAAKYKSRKEFSLANPGAYGAARKKGLLNEVCRHMKEIRKPANYWTKPRVREAAQKYQTKVAFQKGASAAYQKAFREGWLEAITAHMEEQRKPNGYWTLARIKEEAKKYETRVEFQKHSSSAFNRAYKNEWLDKVCSHMVAKQKPGGYWTMQRVLAESKKHKTLKDFRKNAAGAYDAAYESGLLPALHKTMRMHKKPHRYWTFERVKKEAKKYTIRRAFQAEAGGAYGAAWKNGWLEEVCAHMKPTR